MPSTVTRRVFFKIAAVSAAGGLASVARATHVQAEEPEGPPAISVPIEELSFAQDRLASGDFDGVRWSADSGISLLAGRSAGFYTSPAIRATNPFTHIGLRWRADSPLAVSFVVRSSKDGVAWSSWSAVRPDPHVRTSGSDSVGALVSADRATFVQYRVAFDSAGGQGNLRSLWITLLNAKDGVATPTAPGTLSTPGVTTASFFRREQWGADESLRFHDGDEVWSRMYVPVKKLAVHHTDTTNRYTTVDEAKAEVRAIYAYHSVSLGWGDIGYNSLIDKWGNVYEGRHGRGDGPSREVMSPGVVAGHAYFHNYGSAGIALLGTFTKPGEESDEPGIQPSSAMQAALVDMLAWEANRHNIDPAGSSDYLLSTDKWNLGLANLCGHRDCVPTLCPGGYVYDLLPALRTAVAAKIGRASPPMALLPLMGTQATPSTLQHAQFDWGASGGTGKYLYLLEGWRQTTPDGDDVAYLSGFDDAAKPIWKQTELKSAAFSQLIAGFARDPSKPSGGHFTFHVMALDDAGKPGYQRDHTLLLTQGDDLPPSVSIASPSPAAKFAPGAAIRFEGSASDAEDGGLNDRLVWTSSKDGVIGKVSIFSKVLTAGDHIITASVTDSNGTSTTASVSISVAG